MLNIVISTAYNASSGDDSVTMTVFLLWCLQLNDISITNRGSFLGNNTSVGILVMKIELTNILSK